MGAKRKTRQNYYCICAGACLPRDNFTFGSESSWYRTHQEQRAHKNKKSKLKTHKQRHTQPKTVSTLSQVPEYFRVNVGVGVFVNVSFCVFVRQICVFGAYIWLQLKQQLMCRWLTIQKGQRRRKFKQTAKHISQTAGFLCGFICFREQSRVTHSFQFSLQVIRLLIKWEANYLPLHSSQDNSVEKERKRERKEYCVHKQLENQGLEFVVLDVVAAKASWSPTFLLNITPPIPRIPFTLD